jgi:hypothetical protein
MVDRRFSNKALFGLAVVTLGCDTKEPDSDSGETETGGDAGFELVSASLDASGQSVILHFSAPVGPLDGVDPSAFRISWAVPTALCGDDGCVDQTTYWDPNFYANYYIPYQDYSNTSFVVDQVSAGSQATEVSLHFATPLEPILCQYWDMYEGEYDYEFLHVHYKPGDIPLRSSNGESLAAIGSQWVEQATSVWDIDGAYPNLDPKISIPCTL